MATEYIQDVSVQNASIAITAGTLDTEIVAALPAGTNSIGTVEITSGVSSNDFATIYTGSAVATNQEIKAAEALNFFIITDLVVSCGATAGDLQIFEDSGSTAVTPKMFLAASGGAVLNLNTPYKTSAVNKNISVTTTTIDSYSIAIYGYTSTA